MDQTFPLKPGKTGREALIEGLHGTLYSIGAGDESEFGMSNVQAEDGYKQRSNISSTSSVAFQRFFCA